MEGRAGFEKLAEQKRAEFGKGLMPGAQRDYDRTSETRMNTLMDSTIHHKADQRKAWFAEPLRQHHQIRQFRCRRSL